MAQLGSGLGTSYPSAIDTRQVFQNGTSAAPDSDTRVDSEFANDTLVTLVQLETVLGANIQGSFASLAARLDFFLPDTTASTALVPFANATVVQVFGGVAPLTTAQLVWAVWDDSTPRQLMEPGSFEVHLSTFQVTVTFAAPQSGLLVLDAPPARFESTFTATTSVTVPGVAHALGTADLFWTLFDDQNPSAAFQPATLTVHPATFDVVATFSTPRTGRMVLTSGRTGYAISFTNQTTLTIPGSTHDLLGGGLLYQLYDASTPRQALSPGSLTLDQATGTVVLSFAFPQSGRLLLASVLTPTLASLAYVPGPVQQQGRLGPIDPVPTLLRTVQTLETRLRELEAQHLALLTHLTAPTPEETT